MTGEQLTQWRTGNNETMEGIAAELGVHRSTVSRLENLPAIPRLYHLALNQVAITWTRPLPSIPK